MKITLQDEIAHSERIISFYHRNAHANVLDRHCAVATFERLKKLQKNRIRTDRKRKTLWKSVAEKRKSQ